MTITERVLKLIKEPSTIAGIASVLGGASVMGLGSEQWSTIVGGLMMVLGAFAASVLDPADRDDK